MDREMVHLFEKRMHLSQEVARIKMQNSQPVLDASREQQVLASRCAMLEDGALAPYVESLYRQIMNLSKDLQRKEMEAPHD